jgi:hypothetical protein
MLRCEHEEVGRGAAGGFGRDLHCERRERAHAAPLRGRDAATLNLRIEGARVEPAPMLAPFARLSSLGRPKSPAPYLEIHADGSLERVSISSLLRRRRRAAGEAQRRPVALR